MCVDPFDETQHENIHNQDENRGQGEIQHAGDQGVQEQRQAIVGVLRSNVTAGRVTGERSVRLLCVFELQDEN